MEEKSEFTITEQKYAGNEVTYYVPYYFNVSNAFECERNIPDVSQKIAYMATPRFEYFTDLLDHLNKYNDRHGERLSSKHIKEAVLRVMDDEEEEIERNINNIICSTSFQSPFAMNVQKKYANLSLERRLASGVLA